MKIYNRSSRTLFILALAVICLLTGCQSTGTSAGDADMSATSTMNGTELNGACKVELYYPDSSGTNLYMVEGTATGETLDERVQSVLTQLQERSVSDISELTQDPFGVKDVTIQGATIKDGVVTVDMSKEYGDLKYGAELLFRSALVWSLTSLEGVDKVAITVNGTVLMDSAGMVVREMGRDTLLIDGELSSEPTMTMQFTLYFANSDYSGLETENRLLEISPGTTERVVVEQLIAGPESEDLKATVPSETKIRSVTVSDGVCYVDLSEDFINKHNGGSTAEQLTIFSIVNSLCELDTVSRVQFLIEGEKRTEFKGSLDISQTFTAKDLVIE